jgi:very-short-patch-repair endonuclease
MRFFNKKETLEKRRRLRKDQTHAESLLWRRLRGKGLAGYKFYRQYGVSPYIADFYCPKCKLVVELDGGQHYSSEGLEYDKVRSEFMQNVGIKTLRFTNSEVIEDLEKILNVIAQELEKNSPPSPSLTKRGR